MHSFGDIIFNVLLTRSFTKKLPLNNPFTPFDSAQGDRQTERSPRLT